MLIAAASVGWFLPKAFQSRPDRGLQVRFVGYEQDEMVFDLHNRTGKRIWVSANFMSASAGGGTECYNECFQFRGVCRPGEPDFPLGRDERRICRAIAQCPVVDDLAYVFYADHNEATAERVRARYQILPVNERDELQARWSQKHPRRSVKVEGVVAAGGLDRIERNRP